MGNVGSLVTQSELALRQYCVEMLAYNLISLCWGWMRMDEDEGINNSNNLSYHNNSNNLSYYGKNYIL